MADGRNNALTSLAGRFRAQGLGEAAILDALLAAPERDGLRESEVRSIARSIASKPTGRAVQRPESGWPDALHELADRRPTLTVAGMRALGCRPGEFYGASVVEFPMRDANGNETGVRMRHADLSPFRTGNKSHTMRGQKLGLLMPLPFPTDGVVLVCEGEIDVCAAISAGHLATVGTPGSRPGDACLAWLQRILAGREVVLLPDGDAAGDAWRELIGHALKHAGCNVRFVPPLPGQDLEKRLSRMRNEQ